MRIRIGGISTITAVVQKISKANGMNNNQRISEYYQKAHLSTEVSNVGKWNERRYDVPSMETLAEILEGCSLVNKLADLRRDVKRLLVIEISA